MGSQYFCLLSHAAFQSSFYLKKLPNHILYINNVKVTQNIIPSQIRHLSNFSFPQRSEVVHTRFSPFFIQRQNFSLKDTFDSAIITHSSIFKSISESTIVAYAQNFMVQFHDISGLPWWLSIILSTCIVRFVITLPLALYQAFVVARLENARKEMDDIVTNIRYQLDRDIRKNKWSEKVARRHFYRDVKKEWTKLIERDNCHPAKVAILAIFQIPMWVIFSTALRNLVYRQPYNDAWAQVKCLELSVGGVAWFPDLTVSDSFVIPIALGIVNLSVIEMQAMLHKGQRSKLQKVVTNFFRGFSICMIPVAATVPSCVTLYWLTSSTFGLGQNLLILSPRVRKLFGIPSTPTTVPQPYTHLLQEIKNKFRV